MFSASPTAASDPSTNPSTTLSSLATAKSFTLNVYQSAFCGAISGIAARCVISPLDVIKIRLQLQSSVKNELNLSGPKYRGIIDASAKILNEEGLRGFWKGNWPAIWLYVSYSALQFSSYSFFTTLLSSKQHFIAEKTQKFIAGSAAASLATCFSYPFDLLRTRFAIQPSDPSHPRLTLIQVIAHVWKKDGLKGFYSGLGPSLLQVVPYMGLTFGFYEWWLPTSPNDHHRSISPWTSFFIGGLAGMIAKTCVFPLDTLRRRMQVTPFIPTLIPLTSYSWNHAFQLAWMMFQKEGVFVFYRGWIPGLLKSAPSSAVTFGVYQSCQSLCKKMKDKEEGEKINR